MADLMVMVKTMGHDSVRSKGLNRQVSASAPGMIRTFSVQPG
jgi:hypothetical protein